MKFQLFFLMVLFPAVKCFSKSHLITFPKFFSRASLLLDKRRQDEMPDTGEPENFSLALLCASLAWRGQILRVLRKNLKQNSL